jgi:uncharacterized protein involved in exopolysaccharide biosynthesis
MIAPDTDAPRPPRDDTVDLLDYFIVLWRRRWLAGSLFVLTAVGALALFYVLPKYYEAVASLLPPQEDTSTGSLATLANSLLGSGASSMVGSTLGGTTNRDMMIGILKSRTVGQVIVEKFNLKDRYGVETFDKAFKKLRDEYSLIEMTKEYVINITVYDTDPKVAADIANTYVSLLENLVATYATGYAGRQRAFVQGQVARARADLAGAEDKLRAFQETNRAIVLQEQTRGAIEAAAQIKAQVIAHEVQLQVMRQFATDANPDVISIRQRIDEMKRQLTDIQYGNGVPPPKSRPGTVRQAGGDKPDFVVPFVNVPELGLELVRLTRDVRIQEVLVTLLTQQLEQARIAEAKDLPVVRPLDRAQPAERPSKPTFILFAAGGVVGGLLLGVMTVFTLEYFALLRSRPRHV